MKHANNIFVIPSHQGLYPRICNHPYHHLPIIIWCESVVDSHKTVPAHLDSTASRRAQNTSFSNSWICTPTRCCVVVPFGCWRSNVATSSHVGLRRNLSRKLELHGVHPSRSPNLRCANDFVPPNLNIRQAKGIYLRSGSGSASGLGPRQRQMRGLWGLPLGTLPAAPAPGKLRLRIRVQGSGLKAQGSGSCTGLRLRISLMHRLSLRSCWSLELGSNIAPCA